MRSPPESGNAFCLSGWFPHYTFTVDPTEADISSTNAINQTSAERAQVRLLLTHCQNKHDLVENLGFVDSAQELAKTVLGLVGMKFNRADYRAAVEDHNLADYAVTQYQESLQHPLQSSQVTPVSDRSQLRRSIHLWDWSNMLRASQPGVTPIPALVALDENSRALTYVQSLELARQTFQTVLYPVRLVPGYGTTALLSAVPADAARLAADAIAYAELRVRCIYLCLGITGDWRNCITDPSGRHG